MIPEAAVGLITRTDSNGKKYYSYQWRDAAGRRHTQSLKSLTKAEALEVARGLEKKRRKGRVLEMDSSTCTLEKLRRRILEARRGRIAEVSLARYDTALRMLIRDMGEGMLLRNLTSGKLAAWASARRDLGGRAGRGMSPAGVNADLRHIRTALNLAVEWRLLDRAPSFRTVWLQDHSKKRPRHLTPGQVQKILAAEINPDWRKLWTVYFWTGCRRAELHGLTWQDISWEPRPMARVTGKGDKQRWVPLLPPVVRAIGPARDLGPVFSFRSDKLAALPPIEDLRGLAGQYSRVELAREFGVSDVAVGRWIRHGYPAPKRMGLDTITKRFKRVCRIAGLPDARLHDARHTSLTYMISQGVRPRLAQEIAGHASITTTEGYAKRLIDVAVYDEVAEALGFLRQQNDNSDL